MCKSKAAAHANDHANRGDLQNGDAVAGLFPLVKGGYCDLLIGFAGMGGVRI
jgi:hypothetical protein